VRDIRVVNVSLLAKWRWRLLVGDNALWKEVLVAKYGDNVSLLLEGTSNTWPRWTSSWWKDIVSLEEFGGVSWFNSTLVRCVENGRKTSFWKDAWRGGMPFRGRYPRLFSISNQKGESVGAWLESLVRIWCGTSNGGGGCLCGRNIYWMTFERS